MIKAIETQYKGYRFRSRLEARWAVVFDALGLEWVYEPQGFDLGDAGKYLPDFHVKWFGADGAYVEIKPTFDVFRTQVDKPLALAKQGRCPVLCLFDLPSEPPYGRPYGMFFVGSIIYGFRFAFTDYLFALLNKDDSYFLWHTPELQFVASHTGKEKYRLFTAFTEHHAICSALGAGVQARFEHGEMPIVPNGRV